MSAALVAGLDCSRVTQLLLDRSVQTGMKRLGLATCLMALVICSGASAAKTRRPRLRVVSGASGSFLVSDGEAELGFMLNEPRQAPVGSVVILNTLTRARRMIAPATCDAQTGTPPTPRAIGQGRLLLECPQSHRLLIATLSNGHIEAVAQPSISAEAFAAVRLGRKWIELSEGGYHALATHSLLNPTTGAVVGPLLNSYTSFLDPDTTRPIQQLCRPARLPAELQQPGAPPAVRVPFGVLGARGGWVVMNGDNEERLLAWRCGAARPLTLSNHAHAASAQFGAGIVTWIARGNILIAERLDTGRRWRWRSVYGFSRAVHTANMLYAAENCPAICESRPQGERIMAASLSGL